MPLHPNLPPPQQLESRRTPRVAPRPPSRNPRRHGRDLTQQLTAVQQARRVTTGIDPDLVFKMHAAGGRLDEAMLNSRGVTTLGETTDYTYFVLTEDEGRQLRDALDTYAAGDDADGASAPLGSLFNRLESIEPYGPDDRRGPGLDAVDAAANAVIVDVSIWASDNFAEAERRADIVEQAVASLGGAVRYRAVGVQRNVIRVSLPPPRLDELLAVSVIEQVRTPPQPFMNASDWRDVDVEDLEVERRSSAVVGVLDDLPADGHPALDGLVESIDEFGPSGHSWPAPGHHGTLVTGRVLFPRLQEQLRDHRPLTAYGTVRIGRVLEPVPSDPAQTRFPGGDAGEPPHQTIERAIRTLRREHGVRVFNLSVGYREPFNAVHVGELTEMLDDLQRELDVVVVVPTGNAPAAGATTVSGHHAHHDYPQYLHEPEYRIAEPAPAALALTVGAISHSDGPDESRGPRLRDRAVAPVEHLSPFSRTGPGVGAVSTRCNKPDFIHDGGNWVHDGTVDTIISEDAGVAVISTALDPSGRMFRACCGTSYAAPAVARVVADVLHDYPGASANLLRALVASSARDPAGAASHDDLGVRRRLYGLGRPSSDRAVTSGGRRVTMTFDGTMAVDTAVIHPIPVPEPFAAGRSQTRRIRVALAFDPPVRRQRREYLAGTMQLDLYRAIEPDELAEVVARQDPDDPTPPIQDRRRVDALRPGVTAVRAGTLQVRDWAPVQLNVDDGDVYYLVVTHRTQTWARDGDYDSQGYALAVTLEDEARVDLDLLAQVTQQVRVPARVRVEL